MALGLPWKSGCPFAACIKIQHASRSSPHSLWARPEARQILQRSPIAQVGVGWGCVYIIYIYLHYYIIYDHIIFVISDHMFMLVPLKWFIRVGDLSIGEESVRSNSPQLVASIIH